MQLRYELLLLLQIFRDYRFFMNKFLNQITGMSKFVRNFTIARDAEQNSVLEKVKELTTAFIDLAKLRQNPSKVGEDSTYCRSP